MHNVPPGVCRHQQSTAVDVGVMSDLPATKPAVVIPTVWAIRMPAGAELMMTVM